MRVVRGAYEHLVWSAGGGARWVRLCEWVWRRRAWDTAARTRGRPEGRCAAPAGRAPRSVKDVWLGRVAAVAQPQLRKWRTAMSEGLAEAWGIASKHAGAGSALASQLRRATAAARGGAEVHYGALRATIAGALESAEWGSSKDGRKEMEAAVAGAQLAAARVLGAWDTMVRAAQRQMGDREASRGRLGAILWAWRSWAHRRGERGELLMSTRPLRERGGRVEDWLPSASDLECGHREVVSAVVPGEIGAWLLWYARWTAEDRKRQRHGWAAWVARLDGGGSSLRARYERALRTGRGAVGSASTGSTEEGRAKRRRRWEERCRREAALEAGLQFEDGWVMWVDERGDGVRTVAAREGHDAELRMRAREWTRAGVRTEVAAVLEEPVEVRTGEAKRRRLTPRAGRMTPTALRRWREGWSCADGGGATEATGATHGEGYLPTEEEEEMARALEWDAVGDG